MKISNLVTGVRDWYGLTKPLASLDILSAQKPVSSDGCSTNCTASIMVPTTSPVLKASDPTWPITQLNEQQFDLCSRAYELGGAAWMAPYPLPSEDTPAEQIELGKICQSLEGMCRLGLAVDISSASPYKESVEEAAGEGRTIRYFAFSTKGYALFGIDPERKPN